MTNIGFDQLDPATVAIIKPTVTGRRSRYSWPAIGHGRWGWLSLVQDDDGDYRLFTRGYSNSDLLIVRDPDLEFVQKVLICNVWDWPPERPWRWCYLQSPRYDTHDLEPLRQATIADVIAAASSEDGNGLFPPAGVSVPLDLISDELHALIPNRICYARRVEDRVIVYLGDPYDADHYQLERRPTQGPDSPRYELRRYGERSYRLDETVTTDDSAELEGELRRQLRLPDRA